MSVEHHPGVPSAAVDDADDVGTPGDHLLDEHLMIAELFHPTGKILRHRPLCAAETTMAQQSFGQVHDEVFAHRVCQPADLRLHGAGS